MALDFASSSANVAGNTNADITVDVPAGTVDGDVLLMSIASACADAATPAVATPSGWSAINDTAGTTQTAADGVLATFWRKASSEPANYAVTATPNATTNGMTGKMVRIPGANYITPIHQSAETVNSATAPSVTTTKSGCLIVCLAATFHTAVQTSTPPAGYTERWDFGSDPGLAVSQTCATLLQTSAGATGAQAFTITGSSQNFAAQTIAIALPSLTFGGGGGFTVGNPVGCIRVDTDLWRDATLLIRLDPDEVEGASGVVIDIRPSDDGSCLEPDTPSRVRYEIEELAPGESFLIDGPRRNVTVFNPDTRQDDGAFHRVTFDGFFDWPDIPACSQMCVCITTESGSVTAFVDRYDREI